MGNKYAKIATTPTPQSQPLPGREAVMGKNDAGGYAFNLDMWKKLDRFLILGSEGGTYYVKEQTLSQRNIVSVDACIAADPVLTARTVAQVSEKGRAFKNDPAEFVLAKLIAHGGKARQAGWEAMPSVIRTGRTLLEFSILLDSLGVKWPMSRRKAFANWYNSKTADQIAYQVLKYASASGWTHKDMLRLCHAKGGAENHANLFRYIVDKEVGSDTLPKLVEGWEKIKKATTLTEVIGFINVYNLTWEFVPGQWQGKPEVWQALLPNLPYTALIRNLGRLTSYGLLDGIGSNVKLVRDKLTERDGLRKARVHPLTLLIAKRTYEDGISFGASKGRADALRWNANMKINEALEDAFYLAFDTVEPSGKDLMFAIDVSGSMSSRMSNLPISCAEGAAVMAMVSVRQEKNSLVCGFAHVFKNLSISKHDSLATVLQKTRDNNFGGTDAAVPMMYALNNGINIDQFVCITDNETWRGSIHPSEALKKYREKTGINAKLVVESMTASNFSIADPADEGMLDVVGFDTSVPALISKFAQGL